MDVNTLPVSEYMLTDPAEFDNRVMLKLWGDAFMCADQPPRQNRKTMRLCGNGSSVARRADCFASWWIA